MSTKHPVALSLLFVTSVAFAQTTIETVEVRADSEDVLSIACESPSEPSLKEVEQVLGISDPSQAPAMPTAL